MNRHRTHKIKNKVIQERMHRVADLLGLEVVEYKHVTLPTLESAYRSMYQIAEHFSHSRDKMAMQIDEQTGVLVVCRSKLPN